MFHFQSPFTRGRKGGLAFLVGKEAAWGGPLAVRWRCLAVNPSAGLCRDFVRRIGREDVVRKWAASIFILP